MATSTLGNGTLVLAGTTSGTTTVTATAVAGTTTLTLPAATDTLIGKATTDTLTNKTLTTPSISSPTISDGTANGVAYLNGSKVLTTGNALVFDGTNLGVGVSSPQSKLHIASVGADGTATARLQGNRGTDGQVGVLNFSNRLDISGGYIIGAISVNRVGDDNTGEMLFSIASGASTPTERMRLTSSSLYTASGINVGIGTSSPTDKIHAAAAVAAGLSLQATGTGGSTWRILSTDNAASLGGGYLGFNNGSYRMVLDSSGNLGIGTTSPATKLNLGGSADQSIQINGSGTAAYIGTSTTVAQISSNRNPTTGAIYDSGRAVSYINLEASNGNANIQFYTTATNNVNATERARIDSSGNLTLQKNMSVGGATPTTSGTGITFPATQSASTNANTLDDYEEGTWTPTLTSAGGNFTTIAYGDQQGSYTKIGNMVTVRGNLFTSGAITAGSASGQLYIAGLPFACALQNIGQIWTNPDTGNYNSPLALATGVTVSSSTLRLFKNGTVNNTNFVVTELYVVGGPSNNFYFQATYFV